MGEQKLRLGCVFLASGRSQRFGSNKLLAEWNGLTLAERVLRGFPSELFNRTVVVTRFAPVAITAAGLGFTVAENCDETGDIAHTIRLGLEALPPGLDGCLFSVCDQPLLRPASIERLKAAFCSAPGRIYALGWQGTRGNPVIFPRMLFTELASLPLNQSGGAVIAAHPELLTVIEAEDPSELRDIDYRADLDSL